MEKMTRFLQVSLISGTLALLSSCGGVQDFRVPVIKGFDYDPSTATLTIIRSKVSIGELEPSITADELYQQALDYEKKGKTDKAYKKYKEIATGYTKTTKAPQALFRMAQYDEAAGKRARAFEFYQALITNYMGTPLYSKAVEAQKNIAHDAVSGAYKQKILVFSKKIPSTTVDKMLTQLIANAPQASSAPQSQYLRGQLWEREKQYLRAMDNYRIVSRDYPESSYAGEALFRIGSILKMQTSKQGNRNLDNSRNAIQAFDELITLYPKHPKASVARQMKAQISGYDITRSYEVAQFYEKKKQYTSARFYYNDILTRTSKESEIYKLAKARLDALPK